MPLFLGELEVNQVNTFYDEPPQRSQKALNAYQNIALSEKREQITSMFGVDVYA